MLWLQQNNGGQQKNVNNGGPVLQTEFFLCVVVGIQCNCEGWVRVRVRMLRWWMHDKGLVYIVWLIGRFSCLQIEGSEVVP